MPDKKDEFITSNFLLRLGDLPSRSVAKIDSFTVKQGVVSAFRITVSSRDHAAWADAARNWLITGAAAAQPIDGAIELADPTMRRLFATIRLLGVGIRRFPFLENALAAEEGETFWVDLSVERVELTLGTQ